MAARFGEKSVLWWLALAGKLFFCGTRVLCRELRHSGRPKFGTIQPLLLCLLCRCLAFCVVGFCGIRI